MSVIRRTGCLAITLLAIASQVSAAEGADAVAAPAAAPYPIHGFLRSTYIGREAAGDVDQDLVETLSVDFGNAEVNRVTAHLFGDVSADLNGNTAERGSYVFDSARDSTGSDIVGQVYSAYVDIHRIGVIGLARLGRQSLQETPEPAFFDGARLETVELGARRTKFGVYGGLPVHLYQGYTPNDAVGGTYGESRLWTGARARLDWQRLVGHVGNAEHSDSLWAAGAWQRLGEHVDVHGRYTRIDDQDRDVLGRISFNHADWDLHAQGSYYQQMQVQRGTVLEADVYYPLLQQRVPYEEWRGQLSKGLGDHVSISGGADIRRLKYGNQESTYNHDFERYRASLGFYDLCVKGSSLTLTEEAWISRGRRTDARGLDASCPLGDRNRLSAGTARYLYTYDARADVEREDVRTWYVKFDHTWSRALRFGVDYQYEDDGSSVHYHELRCEALCTF